MEQSQQVLEGQTQAVSWVWAQGKIETKADDLLKVLRVRFSNIPIELETQIRDTNDFTLLDRWLDAALTFNSLEEFHQWLEWKPESGNWGWAIAWARGVSAGKAEATGDAVIRILRARFVETIPDRLKERIHGTADLKILDQWLKIALTAQSLDEFKSRVGYEVTAIPRVRPSRKISRPKSSAPPDHAHP